MYTENGRDKTETNANEQRRYDPKLSSMISSNILFI